MAHLATVPLASLLFENEDFCGSILFNNPSYDLGFGQQGGTELNTPIIGCHQDFLDHDFVAHLTVETLYAQEISLRCLILLSTGLENRIHFLTSMSAATSR